MCARVEMGAGPISKKKIFIVKLIQLYLYIGDAFLHKSKNLRMT